MLLSPNPTTRQIYKSTFEAISFNSVHNQQWNAYARHYLQLKLLAQLSVSDIPLDNFNVAT